MLAFNSTWTENFQIYKLYSEKAEELEIKLPTSIESYWYSHLLKNFPQFVVIHTVKGNSQ